MGIMGDMVTLKKTHNCSTVLLEGTSDTFVTSGKLCSTVTLKT